jgi:MraZ protein
VATRITDADWPWALTSFHGTFEHTLDAKNRLTMPSRFRSRLAGQIFVVKGAEPCLSVYLAETYDAMAAAALANLNPLSPQKREFSRLFYANAMSAELDGAGRVMLTKPMLEAAGIASREVVVAGAGECLEIWDRGRWQAYEIELAQRAPELTASLGHPA